MMALKSGVMKSGNAIVDGRECKLKLAPELLLYESKAKRGAIFLKSIRVVGIDGEELVVDYQSGPHDVDRIAIKPIGDVTLHRKRMQFDESGQNYTIAGEDNHLLVGGGYYAWLLAWYAALGCGLGGVLGFEVWNEEADPASKRGDRVQGSLWISPTSFLYDQVTISNEEYLFDMIYSDWKKKVETAANQASRENRIDPRQVLDFSAGPDFYKKLNLAAVLEKRHGLGIDGWSSLDMVNIGNYSENLRRDWAKLAYIRFMLDWINFRSGGEYMSEYGLLPEEYERLFLKTEVVEIPFLLETDLSRVKEQGRVEISECWRQEYDQKSLRNFKDWFLS
jgi:hypothetical protein